MQQSQICAVICCTLTVLACCTDYGFGKLPIAQPRKLPVQSFPTTIGVWHGGEIMAVDPDVQQKLPSAKIVERVYSDPDGHSIDLTLVSANDSLDIHDPSVCLPAQGWRVSNASSVTLANQAMTALDVAQGSHDMHVLYWWTGFYPPKLSSHPWVQSVAKMREKFIGKREGSSLMVRIMSDSNNGNQVTNNFATAILPAVQQLINGSGNSN